MTLLAKLKGWLKQRRWKRHQLDHLRVLIAEDHRFLAHNPVADALTTRYLAALSPDWYAKPHASAWHFRRSIGLEPVTAFSAMGSQENIDRLNRIATGELKYQDGPLSEKGWD